LSLQYSEAWSGAPCEKCVSFHPTQDICYYDPRDSPNQLSPVSSTAIQGGDSGGDPSDDSDREGVSNSSEASSGSSSSSSSSDDSTPETADSQNPNQRPPENWPEFTGYPDTPSQWENIEPDFVDPADQVEWRHELRDLEEEREQVRTTQQLTEDILIRVGCVLTIAFTIFYGRWGHGQ
jgi:hypothetical protein